MPVIYPGAFVRPDAVLIGMNAVVTGHARIGESAIIGAMSFIKAGAGIPAGHLATGVPARVVREFSAADRAWKMAATGQYQDLTRRCLASLRPAKPLTSPAPPRDLDKAKPRDDAGAQSHPGAAGGLDLRDHASVLAATAPFGPSNDGGAKESVPPRMIEGCKAGFTSWIERPDRGEVNILKKMKSFRWHGVCFMITNLRPLEWVP